MITALSVLRGCSPQTSKSNKDKVAVGVPNFSARRLLDAKRFLAGNL